MSMAHQHSLGRTWQKQRIILNEPPHNWQPTQAELLHSIQNFLSILKITHNKNDVIIAIGSQGSISYLNTLLPGGMKQAIAENRYKIKTGRFVEFDYDGEELRLVGWDVNPIRGAANS